MRFLIKRERIHQRGKKGLAKEKFLWRRTAACLFIRQALNDFCKCPYPPPAQPGSQNTSVQYLYIRVYCYLKRDGMVTAIYPSHISIWACFSRWFALRGYECTSQRKESGMAWNGEEAIVERALTGGVFFCHSLDKVSAISLMVNTLFLSHLSLVIYHLPLTLSPFHCLCVCARVCARILFCLCCAFGLCAEFITLFLASLQPKDGLSSSPTPVLPPLLCLDQYDRTPSATQQGQRCHVACACFCAPYLGK